jgi:DMSO/TMAO reductase YedYZ molybdopterin-dependent catalytic subunit
MSEIRMGRRAFLAVVGLGGLGLALGSRIARPLEAVLPGQGWRIYAINPPWPHFDPATWRLEVTGAVEHPLSLTWDEFQALPNHRQTTTFHCVTGWTVDDVRWQGPTLQTLWDAAKPTKQAKFANFVSYERPYVDTLTMEQTTLPNVILAHSMDDAPLSRAHGGPVRLVIPQMYGYKNVKWLRRIELVPTLEPGFWEQNGYDVDAGVGRSNGY